jgi:hypothetical protein
MGECLGTAWNSAGPDDVSRSRCVARSVDGSAEQGPSSQRGGCSWAASSCTPSTCSSSPRSCRVSRESLGGFVLYARVTTTFVDRRRAPLPAPPWYRAADCPAHTASPPGASRLLALLPVHGSSACRPARDAACACWDRADHVPPDFRRISELRCASVNHSIQSEEDYERPV